MASLRLAHLYPEQMNIYGDRGNILTLMQRCRWRDISLQVDAIKPGQNVDWTRYDLVFFGGGQDSGQALIADDFVKRHGPSLKDAIADGLVSLAICGGYQMLGDYFLTHTGEKLPGIGAIDVYTVGGEQRLIGNIAIEWATGHDQSSSTPRTLVGFENHSGRTYTGSGVRALGRVLRGFGNNGEDGTEGAVYQNTHGCYMHGSLLPKNPYFADHLLGLALQRRYGTAQVLAPLDDSLEHHAHAVMVGRLT